MKVDIWNRFDTGEILAHIYEDRGRKRYYLRALNFEWVEEPPEGKEIEATIALPRRAFREMAENLFRALEEVGVKDEEKFVERGFAEAQADHLRIANMEKHELTREFYKLVESVSEIAKRKGK